MPKEVAQDLDELSENEDEEERMPLGMIHGDIENDIPYHYADALSFLNKGISGNKNDKF